MSRSIGPAHIIRQPDGTSTGISSFDRAATVQALVDPSTRPGDFARPGHILPLEAREGGVLKRAGHTEATVDLSRMAGLYPAGILCEIVDDAIALYKADGRQLPPRTSGRDLANKLQHVA